MSFEICQFIPKKHIEWTEPTLFPSAFYKTTVIYSWIWINIHDDRMIRNKVSFMQHELCCFQQINTNKGEANWYFYQTKLTVSQNLWCLQKNGINIVCWSHVEFIEVLEGVMPGMPEEFTFNATWNHFPYLKLQELVGEANYNVRMRPGC